MLIPPQLRCGGIKATIWKNDGDNGPFYGVCR